MRKYIRLYEEYTENEKEGLHQSYSWQDIRDRMHHKLPFIIIDFESEEEMVKCIDDELYDEKYAKQIYNTRSEDGEKVKFPSIFILGEESDLKDRVNNFNSRFDIKRIIIGEYGQANPQLWVDGEQVDIGENLYTSTNVDDMEGEDYYKIDSMYYRFIL